MVKKCIKCNIEKDEILFVLKRNYCRECNNEDNRKRKEAKLIAEKKDQPIDNTKIDEEEKTKKCTKCDINKKESSYYKGRQYCKDCANSIRTEKRDDDPNVIANRVKIEEEKKFQNDKRRKEIAEKKKIDDEEKKLLDDGKRKCEYCNKITSTDNFRHNRQKCNSCEKKDGREYRKTEHGKSKSKKWVDENQDRMTELQAKWFQINKKEINEKVLERTKTDPAFKIRKDEGSKIGTMLYSKSTEIVKYIDCTPNQLRNWYNYCCDDDMTLDNHGSVWQIDHVIAINNFNLLDEYERKLCFNWRNTMPLEKHKNMSKHAKIDTEQIKKHYTNLKEFHKTHNIEIPKEFQELYAKHLITPGNPLEL